MKAAIWSHPAMASSAMIPQRNLPHSGLIEISGGACLGRKQRDFEIHAPFQAAGGPSQQRNTGLRFMQS